MSIIKPAPMPKFTPRERLTPDEKRRRRREERKYRRIRQQSPTRKLEDEIYRKKRRVFLKEHPFCEVRVNPDKTIAPRDSDQPICGLLSTEVHHTKGRGKYYLDTKTWMATATLCQHHAWITGHKNQAVVLLYSVRVYDKH